MPQKENEPRTEQIQYRCTATHKEQVNEVLNHFNIDRRWNKYSIADVMQKAIADIHDKLFKQALATKAAAKKKTIKKSKSKAK